MYKTFKKCLRCIAARLKMWHFYSAHTPRLGSLFRIRMTKSRTCYQPNKWPSDDTDNNIAIYKHYLPDIYNFIYFKETHLIRAVTIIINVICDFRMENLQHQIRLWRRIQSHAMRKLPQFTDVILFLRNVILYHYNLRFSDVICLWNRDLTNETFF